MLSIIGKLIKQLRQENSLTIEELASRAGITSERLEEIESGHVTPSLGVLMKISRSLGSRLGTLLDGQESFGAVVTRARKGTQCENYTNGSSKGPENLDFYSLAQGKSDRHMEPLFIEVKTTQEKVSLKSEHEGEEFIHVLEGSIKIFYGEETHLLEKGDSIYYDSLVPHAIINVAEHSSKVLAVIYTPY